MLDDEQKNNHGKEIMFRCHGKITGIDTKSIAVSNAYDAYIFQIYS